MLVIAIRFPLRSRFCLIFAKAIKANIGDKYGAKKDT